MVFVKVRETYDLHTLQNKMSVIGIHTPKADIIKRNYPGLLMQCKAYRPVSCDVRMACASMQSLSPLEVGTGADDIAPEDVFNPILYKACSNMGMSQIEQYINSNESNYTSRGDSVDANTSGLTSDDFNVYYGLLSNTHMWKHANPQSGFSMSGLRPLVYEKLYTSGDNSVSLDDGDVNVIPPTGNVPNAKVAVETFRGNAKPMPFLNCTVPEIFGDGPNQGQIIRSPPGFPFASSNPNNWQVGVPAPKVFVGIVIVPPSRLHSLFFRLVCEWTLEFSSIRPMQEITNYVGLQDIGSLQHVQDYSFNSKILGDSTAMVDTTDGSDIKKVM
ncbi:capsid protein [Panthera leo smacovirus 1]|uniref:Capsid protein n=1 Tax=Panthera leo smacovirus 1 TaxID=2592416 RepID=A0A513ZT31_9VIRU|nr:capsid protein [Panthera leo smacovirus 1]QDH43743.1 capsid protein [Panthera leo smacovirus 1]